VRDDAFVKIAKALADPTRRVILRELRAAGTLTCSCVCALSNLSQPTISHHIGLLEEAGIIRARKKGQFHILTVNERALAQFAQAVARPERPKRTQASASRDRRRP
jgi:DNA-binding transcriptional ArsR family regulator